MKRSSVHAMLVFSLAAALMAVRANAAEDQANPEQKQYSGTITSIDPAARTVTVRKALVSHTFVLPEGSTIVLPGKAIATIGDLRTGEEVDVYYTESGDTKNAVRIVQRGAEGALPGVKRENPKRESGTYTADKTEKHYSGTIESIDQQAQTLTVRQALISHTFKLASPAKVDIRGKTISTIGDLRTGDEVDVYYTESDGTKLANRVAVKEKK